MEIHEAGGGIYFTVNHTRSASNDTLFHLLRVRLLKMLRSGTTLVEVKSGYGLDLDNEVKMLRVIERARRAVPIDISRTYCGAHAVPMYVFNVSFHFYCIQYFFVLYLMFFLNFYCI